MTSSALKGTAMVGLLGVGVGVNCFGTYYILAQTGALPPNLMPSAWGDTSGAGVNSKQGESINSGDVTGGKVAATAREGANVDAPEEQAAPRAGGKRWWRLW